ncbi:MAG: apolipoprotein N-acyltransferase [Opitutaceae bacterium]
MAPLVKASPGVAGAPGASGRPLVLLAVGVAVATVVLVVASFPPGRFPEAAYVFAVPGLLWARRRPAWPIYLGALFAGLYIGWFVLLWWLRHVTWFGLFGLTGVVAIYPLGWFAAARWALPRMQQADAAARLIGALGLAGLWVALEALRMHLFTGFPWLPLAASQWERPILLQSAAWAGAWSVSFILIFFNLALAAYLVRLVNFVRRRESRFCPEFYLALAFVFAGSFGLYRAAVGQEREPLMRAGVTQPYIPQVIKWDPSEARGILDTIYRTTMNLKPLEADVMFWPEAVTPLAVVGNASMTGWVEMVSSDLGAPVIFGGIAFERPSPAGGGEIWHNAVFLVRPETGLAPDYYAKRHLVPFGEYIPFRRFFPWMEKFVPIGGDFIPGTDSGLISVNLPGRTLTIGPLVCYEDVYPSLARETTRDGAALLFVATNNAWYGEGAAAYQHAAHSVLRAVENRRPLLRSGNGGWSGWIDEYGLIRNVLLNDKGSVYFRGGTVFEIDRDRRWVGRLSFYTRHGDWFVLVSLVLALIAALQLRGLPTLSPDSR